jgi:hypothetical protein
VIDIKTSTSDDSEFREIAHCGGTVTLARKIIEGKPRYTIGWHHQRACAAVIFAVWALPQGVPIEQSELGGYGRRVAGPSIPGCYQVFIGSDSEGHFGRQCPRCSGYWRGQIDGLLCPYCRLEADVIVFLTPAQQLYIQGYCAEFRKFMTTEAEGECVIDMDAVADAAGSSSPKPAFYYSEQSQQNRFTCRACDGFNDILGHFGYCSVCGTRNDLQELTEKTVPSLRKTINDEKMLEGSAKDAVGAFDSFVGSYVRQLVTLVPLTSGRRNRLTSRRFHNIQLVSDDLKDIFDIDIFERLTPDDIAFAVKMFHRRHVYEHNGGEADQRYIDESGDADVRLKQALRETPESSHRIVGVIQKMAANLHEGFHCLIPVNQVPINRKNRRG